MSQKKKPDYFCPKCGSDHVVKNGFTTNATPTQRYLCKTCGHQTTKPNPPSDPVPMRATLPSAKRYIITAAQNATPIHKKFWESLQQAVKYYNAELVVIPGRYRNPTSQWTQNNKDHEWWAEEVLPYLCRGNIDLNDRIMILARAKVQWAAAGPLTRLDTITGDKSGIVGHGNRSLRSIATPNHKHPKIMLTTGACTILNYTDTKQGIIAESNHCFGAIIVEIDGETFYTRQLNATSQGNFIDLDTEFTPEGAFKAKPAISLAMGDTHQRWISSGIVEATFDAKDSLVNMLHPEHLLWHDVVDQHSRNHHHKENWMVGWGKWKFGIECLRTEIEEAIAFVNDKTPEGCKSIIVSSNHDRAVERWLREADPNKDHVNAEFYDEMRTAVRKSIRKVEGGIAWDDPFILYGRKIAGDNIRFLESGESFILALIEHGLHGDEGPNGSRGSTMNLSRIGVKVSKGHNHTAEIINGCYSSGKSTGPLEYEGGGPSSHSNAHILLNANGKRTIIFIINGRYCLDRSKLRLSKKK